MKIFGSFSGLVAGLIRRQAVPVSYKYKCKRKFGQLIALVRFLTKASWCDEIINYPVVFLLGFFPSVYFQKFK